MPINVGWDNAAETLASNGLIKSELPGESGEHRCWRLPTGRYEL